jgi:hypothetical protein
MKKMFLLAVLVFSARAMANVECAGTATDGSFVTVHLETVTAMGLAGEGVITFDDGSNKFGYHMVPAEVAQFFEYDDIAKKEAIVGISAFVKKDFPIFVKYVGPNFVDMDLKAAVDQGQADQLTGGIMRVWKGPGHSSTDQVQISHPVCQVWSNL